MTGDLKDFTTELEPPPGFKRLTWDTGFFGQIGPLFYRRREGQAGVMGFRIEPHHTNNMGFCHGGMLVTFADMAWGVAMNPKDKTEAFVTARLTCDFLGSGKIGDFVEGHGELLNRQDGLSTVSGRLVVGDSVIMTGVALFKSIGALRDPTGAAVDLAAPA
jgi:uncharacterized protein (TIGR00369 family)